MLCVARQLYFSINSTSSSLGILEPFDWGDIDADILKNPPNNPRNLTLTSDSSISTLFVDGEKLLRRNAIECPQSACPTICLVSERDALISRQRRALLCLKGTPATSTLQFTCSVPCPAWKPAAPRIVWLQNGALVRSYEENY